MMGKVDTIIDSAEQQCKDNGARLTNKRKQILSGLLHSGKAMSAYELVDYCKAELNENIPAMSVYRILDFLEKQSLAHKLSLTNKYVACSHITCDHDHAPSQFLICQKCQRVEEIGISQSVVKSLEKDVREAGFVLNSPQLEIKCICSHCVDNSN